MNPDGAAPARASQRTVGDKTRVEGVGLFTAQRCAVTFVPAPPDHGVLVKRMDLPERPEAPATIEHVTPSPRRTTLDLGGARVETVEHVLSALAGLGVDNVKLEVEGPEIPICDGSALAFVMAITQAGVVDQGRPRGVISPPEPLTVSEGGASITYSPHAAGDRASLELSYELGFLPPGPIPHQSFSCALSPEVYFRELAPARTFSTLDEAQAAAAAGLFTHLTPRDLLVIGPSGPIDNLYRFHNEPARHKMLDLIGDLSLVGAPIVGRISAVRSGHALNQKMAKMLKDITEQKPGAPSGGAGSGAMDIRTILATLPHRYPMVMVDRVLEMEPGKRALGVKNVTINEPFFVGHYPAAPIMPGVLLVEAMAQLAGLMLRDVLDHEGKVALLMAMDEVRWRRPVVPGDQVLLEAVANKAGSRLADVSCTAKVEGHVAAEARMKFMVADPAQVRAGS